MKMNQTLLMKQIKESLLGFGYSDNEYLQKYLDLVKQNIENPKLTGKTQKHHVIPVECYATKGVYKYDRRAIINLAELAPVNIEVNLSYSDHLVAHAYLTLCSDLIKIQKHYEEQAVLRKKNSSIGFASLGEKLEKIELKQE